MAKSKLKETPEQAAAKKELDEKRKDDLAEGKSTASPRRGRTDPNVLKDQPNYAK